MHWQAQPFDLLWSFRLIFKQQHVVPHVFADVGYFYVQTCISVCSSKQLTWRDMQHLVVRTSRPAHLLTNDWRTNGVGRKGAAASAKLSSVKRWSWGQENRQQCAAFLGTVKRVLLTKRACQRHKEKWFHWKSLQDKQMIQIWPYTVYIFAARFV